MGEILGADIQCTIPDDLTLPQFILDSSHPARRIRKDGTPWLVDDSTGRRMGLEEIRSRVSALASALSTNLNIRENDVVCIIGQNDIDYPIIVWAVHRLGAIVAAVNPASSAEDLSYHLRISGSTSIIAHSDVLPEATKAAEQSGIPRHRIVLFGPPAAVGPKFAGYYDLFSLIEHGLSQDPKFVERRLKPGEAKTKVALLLFSSGTTGRPKAVEMSHYAVIANVIEITMTLPNNDGSIPREKQLLAPGGVALVVLPLFHIYGIVVTVHFQLFCGLTLVIVPKFSFIRFLESIVQYRVTHLMVVPPIAVLLAKHPVTKKYDITHVRFLVCGGAPLPSGLYERIVELLPNAWVGQAYGLTETCAVVSLSPPTQRVHTPGSSGLLLPGVRARVVKRDGTLAEQGEQGELYVTGPSMALGYRNNEKATSETFTSGWVRTGDEVVLNAKNELFIVGRVKEIFKVRGFQVSPAELESHLLRHPDVADACVVGIPDENSGELPLAFVVLSDEAAIRATFGDAENIKARIVKHVAKAKYMQLQGGVEFIDAIPKTPSGKLLRRVLRDRAMQLRATLTLPRVSAKI